jgi:hypothetical protein
VKARLVAGDTLDFLTTVNGFPATDGWTLSFRLTPRVSTDAAIDFDATTEGSDYRVQIGPATTEDWTAGEYDWHSWVAKSGARHSVDHGQLTIDADPATLAAGTDTRSHARIVLDAINAVLQKRATRDQMGYTIAGRELRRTPIADLLLLRDRYVAMVASEDSAAAVAEGMGDGRRIYVRFARG